MIAPHAHHENKITDGEKSMGTGFISKLEKTPHCIIDLSKLYTISSIKIYENIISDQFNYKPLEIYSSQNGKNWNKEYEISKNNNHIFFDTPISTKYLSIKANGICYLAIDEIEIYE